MNPSLPAADFCKNSVLLYTNLILPQNHQLSFFPPLTDQGDSYRFIISVLRWFVNGGQTSFCLIFSGKKHTINDRTDEKAGNQMNITIKDVAKEAGVSIATVSKVIHEKPSISDATRAHVLQVMEQLDYHPNAQASNFARKCSENIIFLAVTEPHVAFHNPHMFAILCGAQDKIREKNYNFSFIGVPDKDTACKKAKEIIGRRSADGLLIHGSATSRPLVSLLTAQRVVDLAGLLQQRRVQRKKCGKIGICLQIRLIILQKLCSGLIRNDHKKSSVVKQHAAMGVLFCNYSSSAFKICRTCSGV